MPVDAEGKRADVIISPDGVLGRMIMAKPYLHQMSDVSRKVQKNVREILAPVGIVPGKASVEKLMRIPENVRQQAYDQVVLMQELVDPRMSEYYKQMPVEKQADHLSIVVNEEAYIACPIDVEKLPPEIVDDLEKTFKPTYGPVEYIGGSGKKVKTHYNVRIAPVHWIVLEKIGDEWSAVSTGKLQAFGVLSTPTRSEKFSLPFKNTPVRGMGESEFRLVLSACGRLAVIETMDRSNNVMTQRNMVYNIQTAQYPTNIPKIVDRTYVHYGDAKPNQLFRHMAQAAGFMAVYVPESSWEPVLPAILPKELMVELQDVKPTTKKVKN